jgi:hypothetical protein
LKLNASNSYGRFNKKCMVTKPALDGVSIHIVYASYEVMSRDKDKNYHVTSLYKPHDEGKKKYLL